MRTEPGCPEPACNPWPRGTAYVTTSFFGVVLAMGSFALARKAPRRIPLYTLLWVVLTTAVRKTVCCRCEFYGQECSTLMGKLTAMILEPDHEHDLTAGAFYIDMALVGACILYPLPQAREMGGRYLGLYVLSLMLGALAVRLLGCSRCPNTVCLMNPLFKRVS